MSFHVERYTGDGRRYEPGIRVGRQQLKLDLEVEAEVVSVDPDAYVAVISWHRHELARTSTTRASENAAIDDARTLLANALKKLF